ncbi:MAG TPA: filamentous hemagglutinin N-terminal domain-containing protein [Caulobacteraceae bacterium]
MIRGWDRLRSAFLAMLAGALVALGGGAEAQPGGATSIHPDPSLGTSVARTGSVYTIGGGSLAGSNLFESFSDFSLALGATARWTWSAGDPSSISNVINRVTGGSVSRIYGTLDSTALPHAAFYFINPAGIVFGQGAAVNVPGAAYFSTAQQLRFSDGAVFSATTPTGSTLSMAAPSAFGFLGPQGDITIRDFGAPNPTGGPPMTTFGSPGSSVFLAAADLNISNTNFQTGSLDLIAVGGQPTNVSIADPLAGAPFSGDIALGNSLIATFAAAGADGSIRVGGKTVTIAGGSAGGLLTEAGATAPAGYFDLTAQSLNVEGGVGVGGGPGVGSITMTSQEAGAVTVTADTLKVQHGGTIESDTYGSGGGGNVTVDAQTSVSLLSGGSIEARAMTSSLGNAGNVIIHTGVLSVAGASASKHGSFISTTSLDPGASGNAGNIKIDAGVISLRNQGSIDSDVYGAGHGGFISIHATGELLVDNALISDVGRLGSTGAAGTITASADSVIIDHRGKITSDTHGSGRGGTTQVTARTITLQSDGVIRAVTYGSGKAGSVVVQATGELLLDHHGSISTAARKGSTGPGGVVKVIADTLDVQNGGFIASETFGAGRGGNITVVAQTSINLENGGAIDARAFGSGSSGNVLISTGALDIGSFSFISTSSKNPRSNGDAGSISIETGFLTIHDDSSINNDVYGRGAAGKISIDAETGLLIDDGLISDIVRVGSKGVPGSIMIDAPSLIVEDTGVIASETYGAGGAGLLTITASTVMVDNGSISTTAERGSRGDAGALTISAGALTIQNGGYIASDTFGPGTAGVISINATGAILVDNARISTTADPRSAGAAGDINLTAGALNVRNGGSIASDTWGPGAAGTLSIHAAGAILVDNASISTTAQPGSAGDAGDISVSAGSLIIQNGGAIQTNSANSHPAGAIVIQAADIVVDGSGSQISSANSGDSGGAAGAISIQTDPITLSNGGAITTNSATGAAGDISLLVDNRGLMTLEGVQGDGEVTTSSGTNTGGRIDISGPSAIILNGGVIQALGPSFGAFATIQAGSVIESTDRANTIDVAGTLILDSKIVDVAQAVTLSDVTFEDASRVLRGQCPALRSRGETSQLGTTLHGPYAPTSMRGPPSRPEGSPRQVASRCGDGIGLP